MTAQARQNTLIIGIDNAHGALSHALHPSGAPVAGLGAAPCVAVPVGSSDGTIDAELVAIDHDGGHTYAFVATPLHFDAAQSVCARLQMDLVTISSLDEQDWLVERTFVATPDRADGGYLDTWIWTGAVNDEVDGDDDVYSAIASPDWTWISGEHSPVADFDGSMDLDPWNYDTHGAAVTLTDPWTTGRFGPDHAWRISPTSYQRAFVCKSR